MAGFAGLLVLTHTFGQWLADLSFDLPFRWRVNQPVEGVIVIYMDEVSAQALDQKWGEAWWTRDWHAKLLSRLKDCRAKAVVFDILFDRPSTNDDVFISAIQASRQAGTAVIIGGQAVVSAASSGSVLTNVLRPTPRLEAAAAWGLAELEPRREHFAGAEGLPSLAMRTAELTLPNSPSTSLPSERWINFYGPPGYIRHCSYADALDARLTAAAAFADKVCFVGAWPSTPLAGGVRVDEWSTPYSRWGGGKAPGVEITATVFLNLARGDWLTRLPVWAESCLLAAAGVLFGFGLALCRPVLAAFTGLGVAAAVAATASWLMWHHHFWFSWLAISGVQMPVAVGWSVLARAKRPSREKARLEQALRQPSLTVASPVSTVVDQAAPPARSADWTLAIPDHTLIRSVGRGAYGEVWLARNAIGIYHAVKIIRRELFEQSAPFEREFHGLQKFMPISRSHPGLVHVLHVGRRDPEGFIYYVMEAADDETTGPGINPESYSPRNLAKEIRKRGHLSAGECLQLGLDLTAALGFLHEEHLIHRDIKPANIIFVRGAPKLADIGLVTDIAATGQAVTYLGTKGYIAPEGPGTPVADLYSLGKVLYEAAMGLNCESFPELPSTLIQRPDHAELLRLNQVILKACRQDARQRYQSAAEMREELLHVERMANLALNKQSIK